MAHIIDFFFLNTTDFYEFTVINPPWCAQVAPSTVILDTHIRLDIRQLEIPTHCLDSLLADVLPNEREPT